MQVTDPIKFVLNKPEASWTIGKGGNVIRELRGNSGATFDLYDLSVDERVVEVGGLYQFKLTGVDLLLKSLESCSGKSNIVTVLVPEASINELFPQSGSVVHDI